jgi:UDP-3-O-[3-hydroxymyristoyl] glucosamine N-acyltransferase
VADRPEPPPELTAKARLLSELAADGAFELKGTDVSIAAYGALTTNSENAHRLLSYATSSAYVDVFLDSAIAACVVHESLKGAIPNDRSALVTSGDPADAFYTLFRDSVANGDWSSLPSYRGAGTTVAPTAQIHDAVVIGDRCVIMDNVVILPQTYIEDEVVIKPNAVIGGDGFQLSVIEGRRRPVPHAGGVRLGAGVTIGSQTCVDRGLFGELTTIEEGTHVDNLVHVAHSVRIGRDAAVVACAEVSGSVVVGDGAWLGPNCAINPGLRVGAHALVGTGSTVVEDIPPHALAYGTPARVRGWRCSCGGRLAGDTGESVSACETCGSRYKLGGEHPIVIADDPG